MQTYCLSKFQKGVIILLVNANIFLFTDNYIHDDKNKQTVIFVLFYIFS